MRVWASTSCRPTDQIGGVDRLDAQFAAAGEAEQAAGDGAAAAGGVADAGQHLVGEHRVAVEMAAGQSHAGLDGLQHVGEVVRHAAGELAERLEAAGAGEFGLRQRARADLSLHPAFQVAGQFAHGQFVGGERRQIGHHLGVVGGPGPGSVSTAQSEPRMWPSMLRSGMPR